MTRSAVEGVTPQVSGKPENGYNAAVSSNRWYWLTAVLCVLGLGALAWGRSPSATDAVGLPPAPLIGHPAPDFTLPTLEGEPVTLADLRGRPVVLNFWASWCLPCRSEMPELERLHQRLRPAGVVVLGVNQAEDAATVARFRQALAITFPTALDSRAGVSRLYGVDSLPTTFFVDREGVIRDVFIGPMTDAVLADRLRKVYP